MSYPIVARILLLILFLAHTTKAALWQYPGKQWTQALNNAALLLRVFAEDCGTFTPPATIPCAHLGSDFATATTNCTNDVACKSMLLEVIHQSTVSVTGTHRAYLYRDSASSRGQNLSISNDRHISHIYVEKNQTDPLLVTCTYINVLVSCFDFGPIWKLYPTSAGQGSSVNFSALNQDQWITGRCPSFVQAYGQLVIPEKYCMDSSIVQYTLEIFVPKNPSRTLPRDIAVTISHHGKVIGHKELASTPTLGATSYTPITVNTSVSFSDPKCGAYAMTDRFGWIGDGYCNHLLNTPPCYDGGDCCQSTCTSRTSHLRCGDYGYECKDPSAGQDHLDYLASLVVTATVTANSSNDTPPTGFLEAKTNQGFVVNSTKQNLFMISLFDKSSGRLLSSGMYDTSEQTRARVYRDVFGAPDGTIIAVGAQGNFTADPMKKAYENVLEATQIPGVLSTWKYSGSNVVVGRKGGPMQTVSNGLEPQNGKIQFKPNGQGPAKVQSTFTKNVCPDTFVQFYQSPYGLQRYDKRGHLVLFESSQGAQYGCGQYTASELNTLRTKFARQFLVTRDNSVNTPGCTVAKQIQEANKMQADALIVLNGHNDGAPAWSSVKNLIGNQSDGVSTMIVIGIGRTGSNIIAKRLQWERNTWNDNVKSYRLPQFHLNSDRRCFGPGSYDLYNRQNRCKENTTIQQDTCTTCKCNSKGQWFCSLDPCTLIPQKACIGNARIYESDGKNGCCGVCRFGLVNGTNTPVPVNANGSRPGSEGLIVAIVFGCLVLVFILAVGGYLCYDRYFRSPVSGGKHTFKEFEDEEEVPPDMRQGTFEMIDTTTIRPKYSAPPPPDAAPATMVEDEDEHEREDRRTEKGPVDNGDDLLE